MITVLRLAVVAVVVALLARSARTAWRNRRVALLIWRRIRPRHVAGSLALLAVVLTVAVGLMHLVPVTRIGLGSFIGLSGNAIFAPLEEVTMRANGEQPAMPAPVDSTDTAMLLPPGTSLWVLVGMGVFLVLLLALFPWLAYVEERMFREGLETVGTASEVLAALRFGLLHLIMLIPLAAGLAIGVAGYAYGRVYRGAYRRAMRRAETVTGPFGLPVTLTPSVSRARTEAVLSSTVWHTTFNSLIVLLVLAGLVIDWFLLV